MEKILLVEDDQLLKTLYVDLLTAAGFVATLADTGTMAYDKIKEGGFDLILLDVILPEMNAVEIIEKLKVEDPEKLKQKIVFLTNLEDNPLMDKVKALGLPYITKSQLNPEEFVNTVKKFLPK